MPAGLLTVTLDQQRAFIHLMLRTARSDTDPPSTRTVLHPLVTMSFPGLSAPAQLGTWLGSPRGDCMHQGSQSKKKIMGDFETDVLINGQQEKVFDIITTIGHWVRWASVARAVGGVTERPIQLGEPIYEFCRTPTGPQEVVWHITEHDRPRRMKLEVEDGTSITYHFTPQGDGTIFRRVFVLGSVLGAQEPLPYTLDNARFENSKVKEMVESILFLEQKGSPLVR